MGGPGSKLTQPEREGHVRKLDPRRRLQRDLGRDDVPLVEPVLKVILDALRNQSDAINFPRSVPSTSAFLRAAAAFQFQFFDQPGLAGNLSYGPSAVCPVCTSSRAACV